MPPKAPSKTKSFPKFRPAPAGLVETFGSVLRPFPEAERRKMFGYPAAFANGYMFAGLFQDYMVLKLPEGDCVKFLRLKGARPFEPMPGRAMGGFVVVPDSMLKARAKLNVWLEKALEYAKSQPPKKTSSGLGKRTSG